MNTHWVVETLVGLAAMLSAHHGFKICDKYTLTDWQSWVYPAPFIFFAWIMLDVYRGIKP